MAKASLFYGLIAVNNRRGPFGFDSQGHLTPRMGLFVGAQDAKKKEQWNTGEESH